MRPSPINLKPIGACSRCRRFKSKCKPGSKGEDGPCSRCEESASDCIYEAPGPPGPNLSERVTDVEARYAELAELVKTTAERCRRLEEQLAADEPLRPIATSSTSNVPLSGDVTSVEAIRLTRTARGVKRRRAVTPGDAELEQVAFDIFRRRCLHSIPFLDPDSPTFTPIDIKSRSSLLYHAMLAAGSREAEELATFHQHMSQEANGLYQATLGEGMPSVWDLMGVCILIAWLSPVRPPGHAVAIAFELNLHTLGSRLQSDFDIECFRVWLYIVNADALVSVCSGRPCLVGNRIKRDVVSQAKSILMRPKSRSRDIRMAAQLEMSLLISSVQEDLLDGATNGIYEQLIDGLSLHDRRMQQWHAEWASIASTIHAEEGNFSISASIQMLSHHARLYLATFALRGVSSPADITPRRLFFVREAISHARGMIQCALDSFQPPIISYTSEITHINVTFAAVFLLKMLSFVPAEMDAAETISQVEAVTELLGHVSGRSHADALQRLLYHYHAASQNQALTPVLAGLDDWSVALGLGGDFWSWEDSNTGFAFT